MLKDNNIFKKIKIISTIDNGIFGIVHVVKTENNNKKYALKIQKINKNDIRKNYSSKVWREIDFAKHMEKYPNHFMKLYNYTFIHDSTYKQQINENMDNWEHNIKKNYLKLQASNHYIKFLYELKDGNLKSIIYKLNYDQLYSFILQIIYTIYLMNQNGYYHNDIHWKNIAYVKTNKKYIKLFNKNVPTYGYIFSVIDYGENTNKKYILSELEKKHIEGMDDSTEMIYIIYILMDVQILYDNYDKCKQYNYMDKYNINITKFKKIIKIIKTLPEYKYIKKYIKPDNINCTYALFGIMNKKKLCELIGCKESKYHNMLISKDDLIYLLINRKDYVKLFDYFYKKLKKLKLIY